RAGAGEHIYDHRSGDSARESPNSITDRSSGPARTTGTFMKRAPEISTSSGSIILSAPMATPRTPSRFADFVSLTKPRMNVLVLATTAVGYYMAIDRWTSWITLLHRLPATAMPASAARVLHQPT